MSAHQEATQAKEESVIAGEPAKAELENIELGQRKESGPSGSSTINRNQYKSSLSSAAGVHTVLKTAMAGRVEKLRRNTGDKIGDEIGDKAGDNKVEDLKDQK